MTFEEHSKESIALFGQAYEEVHMWLDEFQKEPGVGMQHRKFRHHEAGIREIVRLFVVEAGQAATCHFGFETGRMEGIRASVSKRSGSLRENGSLLSSKVAERSLLSCRSV